MSPPSSVYQATDTKLNRQVALKILPEAFATDPDRLARLHAEQAIDLDHEAAVAQL
jgi:serine/threonine-protein kinase